MVIKWSNIAIQDLKDFKSITKMSDVNEYLINLVKNIDYLKDYPKLGKVCFYLKGILVRQFIHEQHKILYYIENDTIHIIAVIHHKPDIKRKINFIKKFL